MIVTNQQMDENYLYLLKISEDPMHKYSVNRINELQYEIVGLKQQIINLQKQEKIQQFLTRRIDELIKADNDFYKDRWNMSLPDYKRSIAREMSNHVTFARQELQAVLKHVNKNDELTKNISQQGEQC